MAIKDTILDLLRDGHSAASIANALTSAEAELAHEARAQAAILRKANLQHAAREAAKELAPTPAPLSAEDTIDFIIEFLLIGRTAHWAGWLSLLHDVRKAKAALDKSDE